MSSKPAPPTAPTRDRSFELHGTVVQDDFYWLREREDPAVRAYLEAENAHADAVLAPLRPLADRLYDEMLGRIKETDLSVPYRLNGFWYYHRTEKGMQYPIYCRKLGSLDAPEQVLLDLNELARGKSHMALGAFDPSPSGRYLAYSTDPTGGRDYTLVVRDLETGVDVAGPIERAGSVAWALDDATYFYTIEDEAKRDYRLYRRRLGSDLESLVYEEPDERFRVYVGTSRSEEYVLLYVGSHTTSEVRFLSARTPTAEWRLISERLQDREYLLDHQGDRFLIMVNDVGRNFRVVSAPVTTPDEAHWTEVLPHRDDVIVEHLDCFRDFWVAWERRDGLPAVRIHDLATGAERAIDFGEPVFDAHPGTNAEYDTRTLRYVFESFVTPPSVYDVDVKTGDAVLLKRKEVLGGYDPARYTSERLHATAADGIRIPISLVRRRDLDPATPQPMHLTGYGAYGIPYPVSFSSNRVSLLERGVTLAIAHIRGGGEMGRPWHDAGRLAQKMNSFTDFIAAIDYLVAGGRTSRDRLTIEGGSAGGLLIGAVLNLRPDACRAALLQVPFVDVINTMLDTSLPLTIGEFEEWGNPAVPGEWEWIRRYCPYTNLAARAYPAMLVRTSLNDSQVMYWEPAKYVAKLRQLRVDDRPLLLLTNLGAGHSGASGRYDRLREIALDYAYILDQLGRADPN
ncbi:MAG: S9 family peptidase [Gemmatimonadales bacterium]